MSKLVAVRIPDELVAKMEGRKATDVIVAALEAYFGGATAPRPARKSVMQVDLPNGQVAVSLHQPLSTPIAPNYARPAHHPTCQCAMCHPKRG